MKAIVRAILLDGEARSSAGLADPQFGKLREPVLRLSQWARCFGATSASGNWQIRNLDSPATSLGQQPLRAPSVFNFFRPGYVPANTAIASAGLVAPEFQITGETSVAGYTNFMQAVISERRRHQPRSARRLHRRTRRGRQRRCADRPRQPLPDGRHDGHAAAPGDPRRRQRDRRDGAPTARANRVYTAVLLTMASPEYLVQK